MKLRAVILACTFVAGLASVAVGAGLVYVPAGFIVAGISASSCAVLYTRGSSR